MLQHISSGLNFVAKIWSSAFREGQEKFERSQKQRKTYYNMNLSVLKEVVLEDLYFSHFFVFPDFISTGEGGKWMAGNVF